MGALGERTRRLLHRLLVGLSRLRAFWQKSAELHTARFSHPHELEPLVSERWHNNEAGLFLGTSAFNQVLSVRPTTERRELGNLLVTAPTRGGKGLLAVSQLLTWPHSVIVNDIKGDLYQQTAGYRSTLGPVYVVNPDGYGHRYDPLAGKETEDALYGAAHHMLFVPNESDPVFTQREMVMLTQILRAARAEGAPPFAFARQCDHDGLKATTAKLDTISADLAKRFLSCEFRGRSGIRAKNYRRR